MLHNRQTPVDEHGLNYIILGPLLQADSEKLFLHINNRDAVIYNNTYNPVHEVNHQNWFRSIGRDNTKRIFAVRMNDGSKTLIGTCQLVNINAVNRSAELQIKLLPEFWSKGYGTFATIHLLSYAFIDLNLRRVYLHVFESNERAIRLYQKVGFVKEGLMRMSEYINGAYISLVIMGLLRDEYKGLE
jgi:RimJ/RimL family protein N-acetyltransferase